MPEQQNFNDVGVSEYCIMVNACAQVRMLSNIMDPPQNTLPEVKVSPLDHYTFFAEYVPGDDVNCSLKTISTVKVNY